jgi:putative phosphoribosyl transferase
MRAAVTALRRQGPARIVVAVPIGAASTCSELGEIADEVVCAFTPEPFRAVGMWYEDFTQTEDEEVAELLGRAGSTIEPGNAARPHEDRPESAGSPPPHREEDPP